MTDGVLLLVLPLVTFALIIGYAGGHFFATKRSQRKGHRAALAVERGAAHKGDRPTDEPRKMRSPADRG